MRSFDGVMWLAGLALGLGLAAGAIAQTTVRYVHTDALGSVVALTDQNRVVVERREYEPYGQQLTPAVADGPGYTGHVQDAASGLTYMQQRYYEPSIGRFLSVDPVTALDSGDMRHLNRYAYAYNSPYSFTDPDGRCPACDRWSDTVAELHRNGESDVLEPMEGPAIAFTTAMLAATPSVVGPYLAFVLKQATIRIPEKAIRVIEYAKRNGGAPQPGYKGGKEFKNDGRSGGATLPKSDAGGNPISYKEYDVNPFVKGVNRGAERVVRGSNGRSYYTKDHYKSFKEVKK